MRKRSFQPTHTASLIKKARDPVVKKSTPKPKVLIETHESSPIENDRFKILVQYSSDIITILDEKGKITYQSPSVGSILGYSPDELIGKNLSDAEITYAEDGEFQKKFIEDTLRSKKPVVSIFRLRHKDGSIKYFEVVGVNCLTNPIIKGVIATYRDITNRKELEKRKDDYITIASHELKTPVSTISAFTKILDRRLRRRKDKKNIYFISSINKQIDKLMYLINDLLDVNRIDLGRLVFRKKMFSLDELIHRVVVEFQYLSETHQIQKKGEIEKNIYGDEDRIAQVLRNLIANAITYSPKSDKVILNLSKEGGNAIVAVEDFGPGIAKKDQVRIFERFYQTNKKQGTGGFGLGLYISFEIIKHHSGKIWVESKRGKGATFYFSLPLKSSRK